MEHLFDIHQIYCVRTRQSECVFYARKSFNCKAKNNEIIFSKNRQTVYLSYT